MKLTILPMPHAPEYDEKSRRISKHKQRINKLLSWNQFTYIVRNHDIYDNSTVKLFEFKNKKLTHRFQPPFVDNSKGSMANEIFGIKLVNTHRCERHFVVLSSPSLLLTSLNSVFCFSINWFCFHDSWLGAERLLPTFFLTINTADNHWYCCCHCF